MENCTLLGACALLNQRGGHVLFGVTPESKGVWPAGKRPDD